MKLKGLAAVGVVLAGLNVTWAGSPAYRLADATVVTAPDAPPIVQIAAGELRGYIYRLTETWPALTDSARKGKPVIVLRTGPGDKLPTGGPDPSQNFALYAEGDRQIVHGASGRSTLWAAYQLIEAWGVGFYLGGDAVPPARRDMKVPLVEHVGIPVFAVRGNLPWFNFLNSPTTWNPQDYKTFFAQMAKQKANIINFHAYDHEPFCGYDITDTTVKMGGPLMTTISANRWWSPHIMSTKDHLFGTGLLFERGEWGCQVGIDDGWTFAPGRATRLQQKMMVDALAYARMLGIDTCLGFEVTGDPLDAKNQEELRKRLRHVLQTYPLTHLGIWQSECLGLSGAKADRAADKAADADELWKAFSYFGEAKHQGEGVRMARHIRFAYQVMKELQPEVKMVVSGWGGDQHMKFTDYYLGLDKLLPPDVIFASLDNIDPRSADHVSEVYGKLAKDRQRWPVPWFESDAGHSRIDQTGPQTNVTSFEPLLKDMAAKGCEGALGIHWRTRNVEDVAGYLYRFGWNKDLTAAEFFKGYARDHYGPDAAEDMAKVHLRLEEFGPQYVGSRGTVECASNGFHWFWPSGPDPLVCHGPNLAGVMPDENRFKVLEAIVADLRARDQKASGQGQNHAATQYCDLANQITWLVTRARVGLTIWGPNAPMEKRLREAEALYTQGKVQEARAAASKILADLEKLEFRLAFQGLASTCRTRGELGMLATANARYGRYYATFVQRIAYVLGKPLPDALGRDGQMKLCEIETLFLVPNVVSAGQDVVFDAALIELRILEILGEGSGQPWGEGSVQPFRRRSPSTYGIELTNLSTPVSLRPKPFVPLECIGGAYHRGVLSSPAPGVWAWQMMKNGKPLPHPRGTTSGVLTVSAK